MNLIVWIRAQWDRAAALGAFSAGALFLIVGWARVSEEALTAAQVPYIVSGGLGGVALISLGAVFWISADLRDEWRKLDEMAGAIARLELHAGSGEADPEVDSTPATASSNGRSQAKPKRESPRRVRERPATRVRSDA